MVESNAGGDDELQRGEAAEDVGGDGGAAGGEYGLNGMGVGSEEKRNGKRRFPCLEQLEFGGKPARESFSVLVREGQIFGENFWR